MAELKRLSDLPFGKEAIIHSFEKDEFHIKLMEMGCVPGEKVSVEQCAMNGDPICVHVAGYCLSLRLDEAKTILVEELFSVNR
jgi:ferrous iron transport protein A